MRRNSLRRRKDDYEDFGGYNWSSLKKKTNNGRTKKTSMQQSYQISQHIYKRNPSKKTTAYTLSKPNA